MCWTGASVYSIVLTNFFYLKKYSLTKFKTKTVKQKTFYLKQEVEEEEEEEAEEKSITVFFIH